MDNGSDAEGRMVDVKEGEVDSRAFSPKLKATLKWGWGSFHCQG